MKIKKKNQEILTQDLRLDIYYSSCFVKYPLCLIRDLHDGVTCLQLPESIRNENKTPCVTFATQINEISPGQNRVALD